MEESVSRITENSALTVFGTMMSLADVSNSWYPTMAAICSLKFTRGMKIIKIMCEEEKDCKDCHGSYDVSEVRDRTDEEKQESRAANTPKYSLKVEKPIEIKNTAKVTRMPMMCSKALESLKTTNTR